MNYDDFRVESENPPDRVTPTPKPAARKKSNRAAKPEATRAYKPPVDAMDLRGLVVPDSGDDPLTKTTIHHVPVDKPKTFFRVHPDPAYRKKFFVYKLKLEGVVGEQHFIVADSMRVLVDEARLCILATCVYRDRSIRLWPLWLPEEGERDMVAWSTARSAARESIDWWTKIKWQGANGYKSTPAQPGYAPEPDWLKVPPYDVLIGTALGESGIIRDESHPVYRDHILGAAQEKADGDDDDL